jgi:hypothetical protein
LAVCSERTRVCRSAEMMVVPKAAEKADSTGGKTVETRDVLTVDPTADEWDALRVGSTASQLVALTVGS